MKVFPAKEYNKVHVGNMLSEIPLFADLQNRDNRQYKKLMAHSEIIELEPGELIIEKGESSPVFYVLLRGQVDVFGGTEPGDAAIDQLREGQLFGTLGALTNRPRTATLAGSRDIVATILAIDFSRFGELEDASIISLSTKLKLYRHVVNNTRWRLQIMKQNCRDARLEQAFRRFGPYKGDEDTPEELHALVEQAAGLAAILEAWNDIMVPSIELPEKPAAPAEGHSFFDNVKQWFGKKAG